MSNARNIAALSTVEVGATADQTKADIEGLGIAPVTDAAFTNMPKVGTVSIVESGSNSNGNYTKYSDGTVTAHKTVAFSGITLNPANGSSNSVLTANLTMAVTITGGKYTFGRIELEDSGHANLYGNGYVADGNLAIFHSGLRPTNVWPRWDSTGSYVCTQGYYQLIAIGTWS